MVHLKHRNKQGVTRVKTLSGKKIEFKKLCAGYYDCLIDGKSYITISKKSNGEWGTENDDYKTLKEAKEEIIKNN